MAAALDGIRVLELVRVAPGAFTTMMLADMGADVVKIETPSVDDPYQGPSTDERRETVDRLEAPITPDVVVPLVQRDVEAVLPVDLDPRLERRALGLEDETVEVEHQRAERHPAPSVANRSSAMGSPRASLASPTSASDPVTHTISFAAAVARAAESAAPRLG